MAVKKAGLRDGKLTEWRIKGVRGLVLTISPGGAATYYFYYRIKVPSADGSSMRWAHRKLKLGRRDALDYAAAKRQAEDFRRVVDDGGDPAADKKQKEEARLARAVNRRSNLTPDRRPKLTPLFL